MQRGDAVRRTLRLLLFLSRRGAPQLPRGACQSCLQPWEGLHSPGGLWQIQSLGVPGLYLPIKENHDICPLSKDRPRALDPARSGHRGARRAGRAAHPHLALVAALAELRGPPAWASHRVIKERRHFVGDMVI